MNSNGSSESIIGKSNLHPRSSFAISPSMQFNQNPIIFVNQMLPPSSNNNNNNNNINIPTSTSAAGGDQLSEHSDEDPSQFGAGNFLTLFRNFRLKRKIMSFIYDLPSRRFKRFTKRHFTILGDPSSKYKVHQQQIAQTQNIISTPLIRKTSTVLPLQPYKSSRNHVQPITPNSDQFETKIKILIIQWINVKYIYLVQCLRSKCLKMIHRIPLFDYQSSRILFWDLLYCICSLVFYFGVPVHVAFNMKIKEFISINIQLFCWLIMLINVIVTLNTCYFEKGQLINQRIRIVLNYFHQQFISDLFSLVPLTIIIAKQYNSTTSIPYSAQREEKEGDTPFDIILSVLFVFRIHQFQRVIISIEERFHLSNRLNNLIQLFKMLFYLLFITHIFSCFWIYFGRRSFLEGSKSWLTTRQIQNDSWQVQYLEGFYFITVTMISVGYGDIVPQSSSEIILCVIIMLISCFVFAYSVNMIGEILRSIYLEDNLVQKQVRIISNFMAKNNIHPNLRQQVRVYLEYYQRQFSEQNEEEEQNVISQLSDNLKNSLIIEANKFILRDSPIFSKYFSEKVIQKLVGIIKEYRFTPEQIIFSTKIEKDEAKIYFIKSGSVEIIAAHEPSKAMQALHKQKTTVKVLNQGESFGEYQFFTGKSNSYSARSLEFSRVLYVSRKDFLEIIKQHPLDYEKFCHVKDKVSLHRDASCIGVKCYICASEKHLVEDCNMTHLVLNSWRVMRQSQVLTQKQERVPCDRREWKTPWHEDIEDLRDCAWRLQDDNESYIENASWMSWDSDSYVISDRQGMNTDSHGLQTDECTNSNSDGKGSDSLRDTRKLGGNTHRHHAVASLLQNQSPNYDNDASPDNSRHYNKNSSPSSFHQLYHLRLQQQYQNEDISSKGSQRLSELSDNVMASARGQFSHEISKAQKKHPERQNTDQVVDRHFHAAKPSNLFSSLQLQQPLKSPRQPSPSQQTPRLQSHKQTESFMHHHKKLCKFTENQPQIENNISFQMMKVMPQNLPGNTSPVHQGCLPRGKRDYSRKGTQLTGSGYHVNNPMVNTPAINIAEILNNHYIDRQNEENTFETKKIFEFYFRWNNYTNVIKKYNKPILKLIKSLQKNRIKKRKDQSILRQNSLNSPRSAGFIPLGSLSSPKKSFFRQEIVGNTSQISKMASDSVISNSRSMTSPQMIQLDSSAMNKADFTDSLAFTKQKSQISFLRPGDNNSLNVPLDNKLRMAAGLDDFNLNNQSCLHNNSVIVEESNFEGNKESEVFATLNSESSPLNKKEKRLLIPIPNESLKILSFQEDLPYFKKPEQSFSNWNLSSQNAVPSTSNQPRRTLKRKTTNTVMNILKKQTSLALAEQVEQQQQPQFNLCQKDKKTLVQSVYTISENTEEYIPTNVHVQLRTQLSQQISGDSNQVIASGKQSRGSSQKQLRGSISQKQIATGFVEPFTGPSQKILRIDLAQINEFQDRRESEENRYKSIYTSLDKKNQTRKSNESNKRSSDQSVNLVESKQSATGKMSESKQLTNGKIVSSLKLRGRNEKGNDDFSRKKTIVFDQLDNQTKKRASQISYIGGETTTSQNDVNKKLNARRFSRMYNMALTKRPSTKKESQVDLMFPSEKILCFPKMQNFQEKSLPSSKKSSSRSSSSSSSSSNNSSSSSGTNSKRESIKIHQPSTNPKKTTSTNMTIQTNQEDLTFLHFQDEDLFSCSSTKPHIDNFRLQMD